MGYSAAMLHFLVNSVSKSVFVNEICSAVCLDLRLSVPCRWTGSVWAPWWASLSSI